MKKIIIGLFVLMISLVTINEKKQIIIPKDAIRFRIIANSNNKEDQELKLKVKKDIENEIYGLVGNAKNINEAREIIENNINKVDKIVNKYNVTYDINYGNNYFPIKEYKGIKYDEGYYESLVITLGEGVGNNWWCVLFPPLCLLDEQKDLSNASYELYANKLINNFK